MYFVAFIVVDLSVAYKPYWIIVKGYLNFLARWPLYEMDSLQAKCEFIKNLKYWILLLSIPWANSITNAKWYIKENAIFMNWMAFVCTNVLSHWVYTFTRYIIRWFFNYVVENDCHFPSASVFHIVRAMVTYIPFNSTLSLYYLNEWGDWSGKKTTNLRSMLTSRII